MKSRIWFQVYIEEHTVWVENTADMNVHYKTNPFHSTSGTVYIHFDGVVVVNAICRLIRIQLPLHFNSDYYYRDTLIHYTTMRNVLPNEFVALGFRFGVANVCVCVCLCGWLIEEAKWTIFSDENRFSHMFASCMCLFSSFWWSWSFLLLFFGRAFVFWIYEPMNRIELCFNFQLIHELSWQIIICVTNFRNWVILTEILTEF